MRITLTQLYKVTVRALRASLFSLVVAIAVLLAVAEYGFNYYFAVPVFVSYVTYWFGLSVIFYYLTSRLIITERDDVVLFVTVWMTGIVVGLCLAFWKVYLYQDLWTVFNVLAEPIRTSLYGFIIAWLMVRARANVRQATFLSPHN